MVRAMPRYLLSSQVNCIAGGGGWRQAGSGCQVLQDDGSWLQPGDRPLMAAANATNITLALP